VDRTLVDGCRFLDVRTRAALLAIGPDAILCGPTAAILHGCTAIASADTHVLVPYDRGPRSRPGLVVHHSCFYAAQVTTIDQLRVSSLPQVIADLLCTARAADALPIADEALRRAEPNSDELRAAVTQRLRVRPDPRGTVRGAGLWNLASPAAESPPESWLRLLIVELGFPLPEVNFALLTPTGKEYTASTSPGRTCASRWSTTATPCTSAAKSRTRHGGRISGGADGS
jgi:hypothetical protein